MIKREKTRKNPKKMAARFARRQRGGGGSEALGRGVGGSTPHPPIGDACFIVLNSCPSLLRYSVPKLFYTKERMKVKAIMKSKVEAANDLSQ